MPKRYAEDFKQTILGLHEQGQTPRQLATDYEVGYSTILKWIQGNTPISPGGPTSDEVKRLKKTIERKG
ncbi:transposase [Listeria grayi]|uniref:Transposase IS3/IS911 n=1 Tax=Listeria grayi FSL F6-1183 TaxID=1265827 RepID=A0A829R926_LISGR|nr:transposase [Listeria grayi]EUJ29885.1 transposase IS3/IS911 [Listeria grayi FSL F6-1183]